MHIVEIYATYTHCHRHPIPVVRSPRPIIAVQFALIRIICVLGSLRLNPMFEFSIKACGQTFPFENTKLQHRRRRRAETSSKY